MSSTSLLASVKAFCVLGGEAKQGGRPPASSPPRLEVPRRPVPGLPGGRRTRSRPAPIRVRSSDARALRASRVLTRHGDWLLPARQGLLGTDDFRTRVAHSRDGGKAVEELASPPGDRKHRQVADRRAAGGTARSRAEPQLRDRRALDCWRWAAGPVCTELLPPRNRGYLRLTQHGLQQGVFSLRVFCSCETPKIFFWLGSRTKFPG